MDDSKEGREKRAKNISKKLKAIAEIRAKQAAGQALEPEQVKMMLFSGKMSFLFPWSLLASIVGFFYSARNIVMFLVETHFVAKNVSLSQKLKLDSETELLAELKSLTV